MMAAPPNGFFSHHQSLVNPHYSNGFQQYLMEPPGAANFIATFSSALPSQSSPLGFSVSQTRTTQSNLTPFSNFPFSKPNNLNMPFPLSSLPKNDPYNFSDELSLKRKLEDNYGQVPKKKKVKNSGEKLNGHVDKSNLIKTKNVKKVIETNALSLNEIEDRVQNILKSIQRECSFKEPKNVQLNNIHSHSTQEKTKEDTNGSNSVDISKAKGETKVNNLSEIPMKSAEEIQLEKLMGNSMEMEGRKTPPNCCTNCEKLGFRNSPQCLNKRSGAEVDVYDFEDDDEDVSNHSDPKNRSRIEAAKANIFKTEHQEKQGDEIKVELDNHDSEKENFCENEICDESTTFTTKLQKSDLKDEGSAKLDLLSEHINKLKGTVTEDEEHLDRLRKNIKSEMPMCSCRGPDYIPTEDNEGPFYTHLGAARSIQAVRELMEKRTGEMGRSIRIEKIRYTGKEGKSSQGCPIAKWIIRRSGAEEKYLCVVRQRPGHFCETACIITVIVAWEGVPQNTADDLYQYLRTSLPTNGFETERRCGTNERKTCACQGIDLVRRGASFSFGCSWSMYYNGCKFARSREARKFKLKDTSKEVELEGKLQDLATKMGPLYKKMAPDAYSNQTRFEDTAKMCRLGHEEGRPFSGVTACVDFCAHAHKDLHNMNNGSTVVVTLTKHRGLGKPDDEQLHTLPLHVMDMTDEHGSTEAQFEKARNGSLEVLQYYPMEARMRAVPLTPKKKKGKKGGSVPAKKGRPFKNPENAQKSSSSPTDQKQNSVQDGNRGPSLPSKFSFNENKQFLTYEDMMKLSEEPGFANMYDSFWNYFYKFGTFPPPNFLHSNELRNQMASITPSVIPTNLSSDSINTQGHPHGAEKSYQGQGQPPPQTLDPNTRQQPETPLDLSSSGSTSHLKAAIHESATYAPSSQSPLDILSDVVSMMPYCNTSLPQNNYSKDQTLNQQHSSNCEQAFNDTEVSPESLRQSFDDKVKEAETAGSHMRILDPTVVKCEMEYNENAFRDPEIGGVAIALQHGAVLFEVAKRELHATTGLRNPNRYEPTRISLVFYQHKNLNYKNHGWYEHEKKCEMLKQKRLEKMHLETNNLVPDSVKEGEKKKGKKEKKVDFSKTSAAQYKYMLQAPAASAVTLTTDSVITRWIDPQPMVTGPYQRWV
ncbi:methylcytosine dioxygenase tet3-B-like isoform X2 [Saccostrea echinata]|nr:methylcytosine dioxygenase tet3-B-like isoform X2 [Saccostrea echinata]